MRLPGLSHHLIAFLAALVAGQAQAAQPSACPAFRLDGPGGSMADIPVHDQDGVGICYSYSASDLVNAALNARDPAHPHKAVSPLAGAILASAKVLKPVKTDGSGHLEFPFEGDDECAVINDIRAHGYCDDEAIVDRLGPTTYETETRIYKPLQTYGKDAPDAADKIACDLRDSLPRVITPPVDVLKAALAQATPLAYFKAIAHQACPEPIRVKLPRCHNVKVRGPAHFRQILREHFGKIGSATLPIAIGYCSDLYSAGPDFSGIVTAMRGTPSRKARVCKGYEKDDPDDDGGHSSLIIGRRVDSKTGHCQLLIKNSWGTSSNSYAKAWDPEHGKIWVDQDTLERNVFDVSSF